ncbi:hypothetical protein [Streptomyces sp. SID12501]|uniref:hypothetical protein n=1 Tax=Streptomyces sp. SID12501 TaxID=2706042 RepID=UPI001EF29D46|nr:hypothetical protein [Streptomyces sp. SID12501]
MRRGDRHAPDAGKAPFGPYAAAWIRERELATTARQLHGSLLRHHLDPAFGAVGVAEISPPLVRRWRADKPAAGTGPTTVAKAYALLRAIPAAIVPDIREHLKRYAEPGSRDCTSMTSATRATPSPRRPGPARES